MEKYYDCAYAKRRLRNDGVRINGQVPHQANYQDVVNAYFERYSEFPPSKTRKKPKVKQKSSAKEKKITPKTKDQEWWSDYKKYIHSSVWYAFRRMIMAKYNYTCQKCFIRFKSGQLNVHHLHYKNFKNEKDEDVLLVCTDCHHEIHVKKNKAIKKFTTNQ